MGVAVSILVFAAGAILAFAVNVTNSNGVDLNTVGDILMGVGAFGVVVSLLMWGIGPWGGYRGYRGRTTVIDQRGGQVVRREDVDTLV